METLFSGVGVMVLAGLTGLAFRQPEAYGRLMPWLVRVGLLTAVAMCAYQSGAATAQQAARLTKLSDMDSWSRINEATAGTLLPAWAFLVLGCVVLYLGALWALPSLGIVEKRCREKARHRGDGPQAPRAVPGTRRLSRRDRGARRGHDRDQVMIASAERERG